MQRLTCDWVLSALEAIWLYQFYESLFIAHK
jgi:hypothetical protein